MLYLGVDMKDRVGIDFWIENGLNVRKGDLLVQNMIVCFMYLLFLPTTEVAAWLRVGTCVLELLTFSVTRFKRGSTSHDARAARQGLEFTARFGAEVLVLVRLANCGPSHRTELRSPMLGNLATPRAV